MHIYYLVEMIKIVFFVDSLALFALSLNVNPKYLVDFTLLCTFFVHALAYLQRIGVLASVHAFKQEIKGFACI